MLPLVRRAAFAALSLAIPCSALAADGYPNTNNFGVPFSKDEPWYQQCMRVEHVAAPETRAPTGPCNASGQYYLKRSQAETSAAEWSKVRACAVAEHDNAVLMMVYANGFGVQRNADIAIHYACQLDFIAKAEMESRIEHLASGNRSGAPFDQCDDITSGYMGSICAAIREGQDKRVRTARLDRMSKKLTPAGRAAFARLRLAAERYAAEAMGEEDMQGTAAPALAMEAEGRLREQFMQAALDAADGKIPPVTAAEYGQRDAELNKAYQVVMEAPSKQDGWPDRLGNSTIEHASVRKAERQWLAYRDAFVEFAQQVPSGPDAAAVKTLLTDQRIGRLNGVERYR